MWAIMNRTAWLFGSPNHFVLGPPPRLGSVRIGDDGAVRAKRTILFRQEEGW